MTEEQIKNLKNMNVDYNDALVRFAGNEAMFLKFFKKFPSDPSFPDLKKYLSEDNVDEAFRSAHTLKGVTSNLAMKELSYVSSELTELLRAKKLDEGKEYFPVVEETYNDMIKFISTLE